MKLSVSNIAWNDAEHDAVLALLSRSGVTGIEVAPTRLWPAWQGADVEAARTAAAALRARGFGIPALQAILFDKPELQVFGAPDVQTALLSHLEHVAALAAGMDAGVLVFGSPKNRDRGDRSPEQAFSEAGEFFRRAGDVCAKHGVILGLEPNPAQYNCNFMTRWRDIVNMVDALDHPGVGIHLDTACIHLEGDDITEAIAACRGRIVHFHITEPALADLSKPLIDHAAVGKALAASGYHGWLSIEMRRPEHPLDSIEQSIRLVQECYGG